MHDKPKKFGRLRKVLGGFTLGQKAEVIYLPNIERPPLLAEEGPTRIGNFAISAPMRTPEDLTRYLEETRQTESTRLGEFIVSPPIRTPEDLTEYLEATREG